VTPVSYSLILFGAAALVEAALGRVRRRRMSERLSLDAAFRTREFRSLDLHLDRVEVLERRRLRQDLTRYVSGEAGHVVGVWVQRDRVVLQLSDKRLMTLAGVLRPTRSALRQHTAQDRLRPLRVAGGDRWCSVLLRSDAGDEIDVSARAVTLTE
jgi:hypothetical protein